MILLAVILGLSIGKTEKDLSVVLIMAACCGAAAIAIRYLSPVMDLLWRISNAVGFQNAYIAVLLKITGIALVTELTGMLCADAGSSSLGKAMQILGGAVVLYLSVPLFEALLMMVQEIIGVL